MKHDGAPEEQGKKAPLSPAASVDGLGEELFRTVFEQSPIGMSMANRDKRFVRVNQAYCGMLGYTAEELMRKTSMDITHPDDVQADVRGIEALAKGEIPKYRANKRYLAKDGKIVWGDLWVSVVRDSKGKFLCFLGMTEDVTARVEAEQALKASEEKFSKSFKTSPDAININRLSDGVFLEINEGFTALTGYTEADVLGRSSLPGEVGIWVNKEDRDRLLTGLKANGVVTGLEAPFRGKDGSVIVGLMSARIIDINGVQCILSITRDFREHKRAEEERKRLEAQIQQAQKLESLGVLAGGIAHDFNNMLTAVLGNADLALMDLSPVSPARPMLEQIIKVSHRAAQLCSQMLAYSGKGKFVVAPLNLSEVVEEMVQMLEVSISKKAILRYNLARQIPCVEGDATQIRQVIMNLIINASEAIGGKSGVISISTGLVDCDSQYLSGAGLNTELKQGYYVSLEVADTGCGMDQETLGKIFDPFFTTKFTGRGLGLAAVQGIVRGHGGAMRVYSEAGKGTTFKVLLPAAENTSPAPAQAPAKGGAWRGRGTVLVVDDDETIRAVCRRMLESLGFKVKAAADGRGTLDIYKENPGEFSCVLLDLTMPHMDGEETFRELRKLDPKVRVVMSSGYNQQDVVNRFAGKGLAGFIQKPYQLATLEAVLKAAMDFQPPFGQAG